MQSYSAGVEGWVAPGGAAPAAGGAGAGAPGPPRRGRRGFGPRRAARLEGGRPAYIARANDEVAVLVMVESADAVANIDSLLQTPGLDGIMVGSADLAVTMGHLGDFHHPDVGARITDV